MRDKIKDISSRIVKCSMFTALGVLIVISAYRQARYEAKNPKNRSYNV